MKESGGVWELSQRAGVATEDRGRKTVSKGEGKALLVIWREFEYENYADFAARG
jgi:hypothetical protein